MQALGEALKGVVGLSAVGQAVGLAASVIFGAFLTLVLMPYFMISGPRLAGGTIWLLPPEHRRSVEDLLPKIVPILRRYLVGLAIVVSYTSTVAWIGFGPVFHLPDAVLLAFTVGVLELIPVIGPFASGALVGVIAIQQSGIVTAGLLIGFAIALRLSIDNLVGPLVLGEAARIHPVVVIISFVCGAILFGVVGLLIAVPVAVCIKITLEHYYAEPVAPTELNGDRSLVPKSQRQRRPMQPVRARRARRARGCGRRCGRRSPGWSSDGLTPPTVGNTEPSQIHRFGMSQLRQSALTTLRARVVAHARGAVEMAGVVGLVPQLARAGGLEASPHEAASSGRISRLSLSQ